MALHELKIDADRELSRLGLAAHGLDDAAKLKAAKALDVFENKVAEASKVSKDYQRTARAERQWSLLRDARGRLDKALAEVRGPAAEAFATADTALEAARVGEVPATEVGKLHQYMRRQEIRAELRTLDNNGRREVLLAAAKRGDGEPWRAAGESLVPMVIPEVLGLVGDAYLLAAHGETVRAYQTALRDLQRAELFTEAAARAADRIIKGEKDILPAPAPKRPMWDAATKSAFVAEHGEAAFMRLASGTVEAPAGGEAA